MDDISRAELGEGSFKIKTFPEQVTQRLLSTAFRQGQIMSSRVFLDLSKAIMLAPSHLFVDESLSKKLGNLMGNVATDVKRLEVIADTWLANHNSDNRDEILKTFVEISDRLITWHDRFHKDHNQYVRDGYPYG